MPFVYVLKIFAYGGAFVRAWRDLIFINTQKIVIEKSKILMVLVVRKIDWFQDEISLDIKK